MASQPNKGVQLLDNDEAKSLEALRIVSNAAVLLCGFHGKRTSPAFSVYRRIIGQKLIATRMNNTTRTGLVPTPKRSIRLIKKWDVDHNNRMPTKFEAAPVPLSLRPFGGLYNPFAKGCSVLCNHPAPTAIKEVIRQIKTSLAVEGKNVHKEGEKSPINEADNIPEDLFRRYTDTDSRPLTPSPTVTSVHTRTSAGSFLQRRCITPELGKTEIIKRKKIILDLRRSHSQETLYWKPSSDTAITNEADVNGNKAKSSSPSDEKKTKRQKSEDQKSKPNGAASEEGVEQIRKIPKTCINEHELNDEDIRRGKKRKKIKPVQVTTTFHLSEDPETQVATLGPDSMNPSTRPSLIPNSLSLLPGKDKQEVQPVLLKGSFLTDEAFQALKTELDIDVIENTFGKYLNRALREAIKYIPPKPKSTRVPDTMSKLSFIGGDAKMPRKFSKSATRFEVPLDLLILEHLTVLKYLSKFVWVSRQRKQLYKRVFLKYLTPTENPTDAIEAISSDNIDDDIRLPRSGYVERTISLEKLPRALRDALEFHGNEENISELLRLLEYDKISSEEINFRTWCGIVSFAERLSIYEMYDMTASDSCDELEKADFNSMEQRLKNFKVYPHLRQVFDIIRRTHNLNIGKPNTK